MKIRDAVFLVIGGLLVISGMVLNSFLVGDADAQDGDDTFLKNVFCENLVIQDKNGNWRGFFGLDIDGDAMLSIYGDDEKTSVVYLGENKAGNNEMGFRLQSKSKTDKREASITIDENGGRFNCVNKLGEQVVRVAVGANGGGGLDLRDKYGYKR